MKPNKEISDLLKIKNRSNRTNHKNQKMHLLSTNNNDKKFRITKVQHHSINKIGKIH